MINFGETRVVQKGGNMSLSRVAAVGKLKANVRSTRHSSVASLLTSACAEGVVLLSLYILKRPFGGGDEVPINCAMEKVAEHRPGDVAAIFTAGTTPATSTSIL